MQLNASTLNARSVNGAARTAVYAAADIVAGLVAELDGVCKTHLAGDAVTQFGAWFESSATRFGGGEVAFSVGADLAQNITRSGRGDAVLAVDADLFYTRTRYGYGSADISLLMYGHVGVMFIDGESYLSPLIPELDLARCQEGRGDCALAVVGELDPSAMRYATSSAPPIEVSGELEASHIHDGALYVGGYGAAKTVLVAEDAGMLRQAHLGSFDFSVDAASSWRIERPTLAGDAAVSIQFGGDFLVFKFLNSAATVAVAGELDGQIFVRGEGVAPLVVAASGIGYKTTHVSLSAALDASADMDGAILKCGQGDLLASLIIEGYAQIKKAANGDAVIEVLGVSDLYTNPNANDNTEQNFMRPSIQRGFGRQAAQRDWNRT